MKDATELRVFFLKKSSQSPARSMPRAVPADAAAKRSRCVEDAEDARRGAEPTGSKQRAQRDLDEGRRFLLRAFSTDCFRRADDTPTASPRVMDEQTFKHILEGFYGGDVEAILNSCRDESNEAWSEAHVEEAMRALHEDGKTINAPFCFAPGAIELKRLMHLESWRVLRRGGASDRGDSDVNTWQRRFDTRAYEHAHRDSETAFATCADPTFDGQLVCGVHSGECEVGVYVSRAGGDVAEWHRDIGNNFTVQLTGGKEWEVEHYTQRDGRGVVAFNNAALIDKPRCGADYFLQPPAWPRSVDKSTVKRFCINAGESVSISKGRFHRVTPVGKDISVSIDVRVTSFSVEERFAEGTFLRYLATRSRDEWLKPFFQQVTTFADSPLVRGDVFPPCLNDFPMPQICWLPFETDFSDGLVLGARLKYIVGAATNVAGHFDTYSSYSSIMSQKIDDELVGLVFNPVCTCACTTTGKYHVLNIKATSAITNRDLMSEFNIYVDRSSVNEREMEAFENPFTFVRSESRNASKVQRIRVGTPVDVCAPDSYAITEAFGALRHVLADAGILMEQRKSDVLDFWKAAYARHYGGRLIPDDADAGVP